MQEGYVATCAEDPVGRSSQHRESCRNQDRLPHLISHEPPGPQLAAEKPLVWDNHYCPQLEAYGEAIVHVDHRLASPKNGSR